MGMFYQKKESKTPLGQKRATVKWGRANEGTDEHPDVRCRLVVQRMGYGNRLGELFAAGTPNLTIRQVDAVGGC